jgi:NTP pyrophosphatase (non-canonical NTP hydrolase)
MNLNQIADTHFAWVERMGWHNKTVLEAIALIASEVGEAAAECLEGAPTEAFGEELADIALRTVDLAKWQGVTLSDVVDTSQVTWHGKTLLEQFADVLVDLARWVNTARSATLSPEFGALTGRILSRVLVLAEQNGVDLEAQILRKMAINEQRGTRGRLI